MRLPDSDVPTTANLLLFQRAFEQSQDAILITDADIEGGGPFIVFVNSAYERMSGYRGRDLIGETPRRMQGPETDAQLLRDLGQAIRAGRGFHGETVNYRADRTPYWVEWDITPIRDDDGVLRNFLSIQRDTTQRRHAEEALDQAMAALGRSNERLRGLARILAHDLQDPLGAVRGYLELTDRIDGHRMGAGRDYIATAIQAVDRISGKIHELVGSAERVTERVSPVDIHEPLGQALEDVYGLRERTGARIEVVGNDTVLAEPSELREIMQNLLSNALKYRHPGRPPVIRIRAGRLRDMVAQIVVEDNGRGMSAAQLDTMFEEGVRGHDGGAGLGLAYVRQTLEAAGGTISARSREGEGTIFTITLPAARSPADGPR